MLQSIAGKIQTLAVGVLVAAAALIAGPAAAQVTRLDLQVVESPALEGREIPGIGQYERLRGVAHGELDPSDPRNAVIVNLDRAPRNDRGRVEYATMVEVYRPIDMARWNRAIYHTVANRGRAVEPDRALVARGMAFVQVGWQGDIESTESNIVASLPVATGPDGSPIVGTAMEEFIFDDANPASTARLTYPTASMDAGSAKLTVRQFQSDPRQTPPDLKWRFLNDRQVRIDRPHGFDGGAIYELVYQAKDPIVMGIGFAAMRDVISFLRYADEDEAGNRNPLAHDGTAEVALSIGISQSGRYLRDMLYLGFNEDLEGRIVFDGMHPDIAGSRKTFTNYAFAQPGRWQKQHEDHVYPGDQFPFTYSVLFDPISGRTDGILARCLATATCPKIVHTDGGAEIWQARSSLVVTDPAGGHIELPENVRAYLIAGTQHGGGSGVHARTITFGSCQNRMNPMPLADVRRALTVALFEWVADDRPPPPSRFPTIANGGLVPANELDFPQIPGVTYSGSFNRLHLHDLGTIPPVAGGEYPVFVGRVDDDGNMMNGVLHPNLSVPIGTYTGWNLRREGFAAGEQCGGSGSFIPFAATEAERRASGDPRLSIEERYGSLGGYVTELAAAARRLAYEGYLLPEDAEVLIEEALMSGVGNRRD